MRVVHHSIIVPVPRIVSDNMNKADLRILADTTPASYPQSVAAVPENSIVTVVSLNAESNTLTVPVAV